VVTVIKLQLAVVAKLHRGQVRPALIQGSATFMHTAAVAAELMKLVGRLRLKALAEIFMDPAAAAVIQILGTQKMHQH
jgi:hypothetical protein